MFPILFLWFYFNKSFPVSIPFSLAETNIRRRRSAVAIPPHKLRHKVVCFFFSVPVIRFQPKPYLTRRRFDTPGQFYEPRGCHNPRRLHHGGNCSARAGLPLRKGSLSTHVQFGGRTWKNKWKYWKGSCAFPVEIARCVLEISWSAKGE